jgi:hypothetical protein
MNLGNSLFPRSANMESCRYLAQRESNLDIYLYDYTSYSPVPLAIPLAYQAVLAKS